MEAAKNMRSEIEMNYKSLIYKPVHEHRLMASRKFTHRMEYIDINAYGIGGKVYLHAQESIHS